MLPVTQHLADAPEADVKAIALYLMSLQSGAGSAPQAAATAPNATGTDAKGDQATQASLQSGSIVFNASCASCHGAGAPMSTLSDRPPLSRSTSLSADDPRNTVRQILEGIPWEGSGATRYMPAFGTLLTDTQIADVANYTRATYTGKAGWSSLDGAAVKQLRK
jgi:mono/diheme cytochrome c family protein